MYIFCYGRWQSKRSLVVCLTHWGRVTHVYVGKLAIIAYDNGLSPGRRQAIILTITGILLIGPLETNFREILIEISSIFIDEHAFENMVWKMVAILSWLQCVNHRRTRFGSPQEIWSMFVLCYEMVPIDCAIIYPNYLTETCYTLALAPINVFWKFGHLC